MRYIGLGDFFYSKHVHNSYCHFYPFGHNRDRSEYIGDSSVSDTVIYQKPLGIGDSSVSYTVIYQKPLCIRDSSVSDTLHHSVSDTTVYCRSWCLKNPSVLKTIIYLYRRLYRIANILPHIYIMFSYFRQHRNSTF